LSLIELFRKPLVDHCSFFVEGKTYEPMSNEEALCDKAKVFFFLFIFLLAIFKGNHPFRFGEISLTLLAFAIIKIYF